MYIYEYNYLLSLFDIYILSYQCECMNNKIVTTIKVDREIYSEFKMFSIRHKLNLQQFLDRVMFKYVNDDAFRDNINNFILPTTSGAEFPNHDIQQPPISPETEQKSILS